MYYETWLNIINEFKNGNINEEKLILLEKSPINNNINDLIIPKIEELIKTRFEIQIKKITKDLSNIFTDINYLDLTLVNFKKELNYLKRLSELKQLPIDNKTYLKEYLENKSNQVYDILSREAKVVDYTGMYEMTINNNKMKWSD